MGVQRLNYYAIVADHEAGLSINKTAQKNECSESFAQKVIHAWKKAKKGDIEGLAHIRAGNPALADWATNFLPEKKSAICATIKREDDAANRLDMLAKSLAYDVLEELLACGQDIAPDDVLYARGQIRGIQKMLDALSGKKTKKEVLGNG